jgi:hypothetical protein
MNDNILSRVPATLFAPTRNDLPQALPDGPATQRVVIRLPNGTRAEITYVKLKNKKGKSVRWLWIPDAL